jgi:hypothetical protein
MMMNVMMLAAACLPVHALPVPANEPVAAAMPVVNAPQVPVVNAPQVPAANALQVPVVPQTPHRRRRKDNVLQRLGQGSVDAGFDGFHGLTNMYLHPSLTAKGVGRTIAHPIRTGKALGQEVVNAWRADPAHAVGYAAATLFPASIFRPLISGAIISPIVIYQQNADPDRVLVP